MALVPLSAYVGGGGPAPRDPVTSVPVSAGAGAGDQGPDMGDRALRVGIKLAPTAINALANPSSSPVVTLATNPSSLTAGDASSLVGLGAGIGSALTDDPAAKAGLATAAYGASAIASPFTAAWGAPQFADTMWKLINGQEEKMRWIKRQGQATQLSGAVASGTKLATEYLRDGDLDGAKRVLGTTIGGARLGDSLAAMVHHNQAGTWWTDTSHGWFPDPALKPLQEQLKAMGYEYRGGGPEAEQGHVGGVGEMVAGGGAQLLPPDILGFLTQNLANMDEGGPTMGPPLTDSARRLGITEDLVGSAGQSLSDPRLGALGWNYYLRQMAEAATGQTSDLPLSASFAFDAVRQQPTYKNADEGGTGESAPPTGRAEALARYDEPTRAQIQGWLDQRAEERIMADRLASSG